LNKTDLLDKKYQLDIEKSTLKKENGEVFKFQPSPIIWLLSFNEEIFPITCLVHGPSMRGWGGQGPSFCDVSLFFLERPNQPILVDIVDIAPIQKKPHCFIQLNDFSF